MRDLPLYPFPSPLLPGLRAVKATMPDLPTVRPVAARGGAGRVLAAEAPPFITDFALVGAGDAEGLHWALRWVLGDHDDFRSHSWADWLTMQFGAEVREVQLTDDERMVQSGVRFE